jgi:hypothetical protein
MVKKLVSFVSKMPTQQNIFFEQQKTTMKGHRFEFAKRGKHVCPSCGQKTFVLYIDNYSGNPLHSAVGKCDRENN